MICVKHSKMMSCIISNWSIRLVLFNSEMYHITLTRIGIVTECWIKRNNVGLNGKVILTTTEKEITIHAPAFIVRVTNNPVFCLGLVVKAPSNKHD